MSIIAKRFANHKANFIWQPLLASSFIVIILAAFGGFEHINLLGFIGTSTLGSSAFLVFTMPSSAAATNQRMWGAYILSIIIGALFSLLAVWLEKNFPQLSQYFFAEIAAILAVTLTMFLMALLNFEHPPAAGLALGLIVEPWTLSTLWVILLIVILMSLVKWLVRHWLIDLVIP